MSSEYFIAAGYSIHKSFYIENNYCSTTATHTVLPEIFAEQNFRG